MSILLLMKQANEQETLKPKAEQSQKFTVIFPCIYQSYSRWLESLSEQNQNKTKQNKTNWTKTKASLRVLYQFLFSLSLPLQLVLPWREQIWDCLEILMLKKSAYTVTLRLPTGLHDQQSQRCHFNINFYTFLCIIKCCWVLY